MENIGTTILRLLENFEIQKRITRLPSRKQYDDND